MPKFLDTLERKLGFDGIPHLTTYIVIGQLAAYGAGTTKPQLLESLILLPDKVLDGEIWRLFTFILIPPSTNLLFAFFALYLFYLMGESLESSWGTFKYNAFLLIGYVATVAVSFITPQVSPSNYFLAGAVFLAFAQLNPEFEIALFFILPIKIKWLAMITWIFYFIAILTGSWTTRLVALAAIMNLLIFFGKDIVFLIRSGKWRMGRRFEELKSHSLPQHICCICQIDNKSNPQEDFRYCSKCFGPTCYCSEHLRSHLHIAEGETPRLEKRD